MTDRSFLRCMVIFLWLKLAMVAVVLIGYGMARR